MQKYLIFVAMAKFLMVEGQIIGVDGGRSTLA